MRILHILDHSVPVHSGYSYRTLGILREQRAAGFEVVALTGPKQPPTSASSEFVEEQKFLRTRPTRMPSWVPKIAREYDVVRAIAGRLENVARAWQPDILHAHSPVLNALAALRVGSRLRIPVVYEVRALWEDAVAGHGIMAVDGMLYGLARRLETYAVCRADAVVTISKGLCHELCDRGGDPEAMFIVPNAVDDGRFLSTHLADTPGGKNMRHPMIGFVGSFYAYEGLDLLLEAVSRIVDKRPDTRVRLVGGGREEAQLRELVVSRRLDQHVTLTGWIPHNQIPFVYRDIDLLVYPRRRNRLTELVTPLKPLEAMAMAKVVLASDVGGHRELIEDGRTGVLFKADDVSDLVARLSTLLDQRQNWAKIGMAARQFVERERTWKTVVATYAQVYGRACTRSRSPRGCDGDRPLRPAPD